MATVVLAEDTLLGRRVALKRVGRGADLRALARLRREAQLGASMSHSNLVSIYDVLDAEDGDVVIVMEYVPGENLRDRLRRDHALDHRETVRILTGVAAGLDAIHARGIVHRDVKPPNVLLGTDQAVKLADLGIASVPESTQITTAGTLLGSFSYMAPEQLRDTPATLAIDIYALAAMAFEMLSGAKARPEPTALAVAHALATQPPPDLRSAWPKAPSAAARALRRGMAREPERRPRSAGELVAELREALAPTQVTRPVVLAAPANEAKPATARRRAPLLGVLALALVALAVALVVATNGPGTRHRTTSAGVSRPRAATGHRARATAKKRAAARASSRRAASATTPAQSATVAVPPANTSSAASTTRAGAGSAAAAQTNSGAAATPNGPVSAVESFYELAAAHRYAQAWALADPTFRSQLAGYQSFESGQQGDRSIIFDSAQVTSASPGAAVVAVRTTSIRVGGTQHCSGTVDVVRSGGSWLLHLIDINCS
jgi:hypothetical protein